MIANDAGEVLAGRSGRTGPNLFNLGGHVIGGVDGFRYGESILAVNATGATWTEETLASYLLDPTEWLRTTLDDRRARSKMSFRVRSETDAADISAYLLTFSE